MRETPRLRRLPRSSRRVDCCCTICYSRSCTTCYSKSCNRHVQPVSRPALISVCALYPKDSATPTLRPFCFSEASLSLFRRYVWANTRPQLLQACPSIGVWANIHPRWYFCLLSLRSGLVSPLLSASPL